MDTFWQNITVLVIVGSATLFLVYRFRPGRKKKNACSACRMSSLPGKNPVRRKSGQ